MICSVLLRTGYRELCEVYASSSSTIYPSYYAYHNYRKFRVHQGDFGWYELA